MASTVNITCVCVDLVFIYFLKILFLILIEILNVAVIHGLDFIFNSCLESCSDRDMNINYFRDSSVKGIKDGAYFC